MQENLVEKKIIVALDSLSLEQALSIAEKLKGRVWGFKVNDLLISHGTAIIDKLRKYGEIFADPKLYDIPNTVKNSVHAISKAGASLISVHASGGHKMLEAAVSATNGSNSRILAVTVLTSFDREETKPVYLRNAEELVLELAKIAMTSGCHGLVCSPKETKLFSCDDSLSKMIKVTPGIRSANSPQDDQQRTLSALSALQAGSDLLVIGRPITTAKCPVSALEEICGKTESFDLKI